MAALQQEPTGSRAEIKLLLETIKNDKNLPPYLYPMIVTAAHTGARRSELLRAIKTDVEFTQGVITLREKNALEANGPPGEFPCRRFCAKCSKPG